MVDDNQKLKVAMLGQKTILSRKGGVEVVVKELSERMVKNGLEVTCYNRREKGEKRPKEYNGISMKYAWTINKKGLAALTSSFFATIMVLFSKNNVVHYHAEGPCAWLWIIKFFSKKKVVATIHGLDWQQKKWGKFASRWIRFGEKVAAKYADEIIVLSKATQKYFKTQYNRKTQFIPNGVSKPKILPAKKITKKYSLTKDDYILFLGRIIPDKGVQYLIDAFKEINTNKKLVIAGDASDTKNFLSQIKQQAGNDKNIIFTGFVDGDEFAELYSNAYIYVLPSDLEGMPLGLLEAMSYGNCCVTSDIEECASIIEKNGAIFKKSDTNDLSKILKTLADNDKLVNNFKSKSQKFILQKYNWENVTESTINIYTKDLTLAGANT